VVDHKPHHFKVEGSSPATSTQGEEEIKKSAKFLQKVAKKMAKPKNVYIKAQFKSPKHLH
jgi:hypothetical protein